MTKPEARGKISVSRAKSTGRVDGTLKVLAQEFKNLSEYYQKSFARQFFELLIDHEVLFLSADNTLSLDPFVKTFVKEVLEPIDGYRLALIVFEGKVYNRSQSATPPTTASVKYQLKQLLESIRHAANGNHQTKLV